MNNKHQSKMPVPCTMGILFLLFLVALCAAPGGASAQMELSLPVAADNDTVHINLNFNGDEVHLFGSVPPNCNGVAALLRSHETPPVLLARKARVVIFWMTVKKFLVKNLPGCYQIASNIPLDQIVQPDSEEARIFGYETLESELRHELVSGEAEPDDEEVLLDGLIKMKEGKGLYKIDEDGVRLHDNGLFLGRFYLPAAITVGEYVIQVYAFQKGRVVATGETSLSVEKRGLTQFLSYTAANYSVYYAIIAVSIALFAGIFVSFVFKKKSAH